MTSASASIPVAPVDLAPATHIGPALVTAIEGGVCRCLVGDSVRIVEQAMPLRYHPTPGDVLLVMATAEAVWAVGVIQGRGATSLETDGDIELRARRGEVRLSAQRGITLDGNRTRIRARRLELDADTILTRCRDLVQRIKGMLRCDAGRRRTRVSQSSHERAGTYAVRSEHTLSLDGEHIHLG